MYQKPNNLLIFSIALNGYQWLYRDCLLSHQTYASRIQADYVKVQRPLFTSVGNECCWLKLLLLKEALQHHYEYVLFLDADTEVKISAPDIRTQVRDDKFIYMAKGETARFNSGVLLLKQSWQAQQFVEQVMLSRSEPLAPVNDVGWGENGHIIQQAQNNPWIQEIDQRWNNTWQPELADYIRHYNHGIMRNQKSAHRWMNLAHRALAKTSRAINRSLAREPLAQQTIPSDDRLLKLLMVTRHYYSRYF